jgi:hypothetical protein
MILIARLILLLLFLCGCCRATAEGVSPFGNVLVWQASEQTSSIWANAVTSSGSLKTFSAANVDFDWNAGFRIGIAHEPEEPAWDTKIYWTSFRSSANASFPAGEQEIVPEFFSGLVSGDAKIFDGANIDWDLKFNTIDFELGHTLDFDDSVYLRPYMGLKAAAIDQVIQADWTSTLGLEATERIDHDYYGFGPAFGIGGRYLFPKYNNLRAVGTFSGALLWGVWNVEDAYQRTDLAFPILTYGAFTTSMKDSGLGTLNLNYFLGLEWVRQENITITGRLGYELQWWGNQQRQTTFQQLPMHGDLTLKGLTCDIFLGF